MPKVDEPNCEVPSHGLLGSDVGHRRFGGPCCFHIPGEVSGGPSPSHFTTDILFWHRAHAEAYDHNLDMSEHHGVRCHAAFSVTRGWICPSEACRCQVLVK